MDDRLPCLELLEATPEILRGLMSEMRKRTRAGSRRRAVFPSRKCSPTSPIRRVIATDTGGSFPE